MKKLLLFIVTMTFAISDSISQNVQHTSTSVSEDESKNSSSSDAGGPPTKQQLVGFWKMVELPKKGLNQVEPWPLPFQWFAFYEDGKVYSLMTSQDANHTAKDLDEIFKILSNTCQIVVHLTISYKVSF